MRNAWRVVCLCGCLCGMSPVAVADSGSAVKLSALVETLSTAPRKLYTPLPTLAAKSCSITCGRFCCKSRR
jgi:hypothetical protein